MVKLVFWAPVFIVFLLAPLVGCESKGNPVVGDTRELGPREDPANEKKFPAWYPHAVDVRVHPASRYIRAADENGEIVLQLEARIELLDQFNEPVKDVGQMKIELRLLGPNGRIVRDEQGRQRGFRWEHDLRTAEQQQVYWDPIARAYIFGLKIDDPLDKDVPNFRTVLRVTFDSAWPGQATLPTGDRAQQPVEIRTDW